MTQYIPCHKCNDNGKNSNACHCNDQIIGAQMENPNPDQLNIDTNSSLLPCPFCGGKAYREVKHDILQVGCNNCLITFANHIRFGCRADTEWNTRTKDNKQIIN